MIAVLGASGFVGTSVADVLEARGERVARLARPEFDLLRPETYGSIPEDADVVLHAAGTFEEHDEDAFWRTNVVSAQHLARFLNDHRRPRLVAYASSGAVYGYHAEPVNTETRPRPESAYGLSRLLAETTFDAMLDCQVVALRIFFPFGAGQKAPRLIPRLAQRISWGEEITLNGETGFPIINPIHVALLAERIAAILDAPARARYNLAGPTAVSIRRICELIGELLGAEPRFRVVAGSPRNMISESEAEEIAGPSFEEQLRGAVTAAVAG